MPITTAPMAGRPVDSNGEFRNGLFDCCGDVGSCMKDSYEINTHDIDVRISAASAVYCKSYTI